MEETKSVLQAPIHHVSLLGWDGRLAIVVGTGVGGVMKCRRLFVESTVGFSVLFIHNLQIQEQNMIEDRWPIQVYITLQTQYSEAEPG